MKNMIYLTALLSLFMSCNKTVEPQFNLDGNWGLMQTELYENGNLNGNAFSQEITTYYKFENCNRNDESCRLTITEDGETGVYSFVYNAQEKLFIVNGNSTYYIEKMDGIQLVFYKEYAPYKSRYTFQKVD